MKLYMTKTKSKFLGCIRIIYDGEDVKVSELLYKEFIDMPSAHNPKNPAIACVLVRPKDGVKDGSQELVWLNLLVVALISVFSFLGCGKGKPKEEEKESKKS